MKHVTGIINSMDLTPPDDPGVKDVMSRVTFFISVMAVAGLGSVARVLHDYQSAKKIQRRIWYAYLTSGLLAGIVIACLLVQAYGPSYLLIGLAGLAGFQSVQMMTWLALLLQSIVERVFKNPPPPHEEDGK